MGLIPGSGRSPGKGNGNPLQCLKNPMDRGAWRTIIHGAQTVRHTRACTHAQYSHIWMGAVLLLLLLSRFSRVRLCDLRLLCPWGFSKQEYWSGLPCPPPGNLPYPGTEPRSPAVQGILYCQLPGKPNKSTPVFKSIFNLS